MRFNDIFDSGLLLGPPSTVERRKETLFVALRTLRLTATADSENLRVKTSSAYVDCSSAALWAATATFPQQQFEFCRSLACPFTFQTAVQCQSPVAVINRITNLYVSTMYISCPGFYNGGRLRGRIGNFLMGAEPLIWGRTSPGGVEARGNLFFNKGVKVKNQVLVTACNKIRWFAPHAPPFEIMLIVDAIYRWEGTCMQTINVLVTTQHKNKRYMQFLILAPYFIGGGSADPSDVAFLSP